MPRSINLKIEEKLKEYFNGELKRKALIFKKKSKQKFPDEYYSTLNSVNYVTAYTTKGYISDPTGEKAARLADLTLERNRQYKQYLLLHQTITGLIRQLNKDDLLLLKLQLELKPGGLSTANYSKGKAKRRIREILKEIDNKIMRAKVYEEHL